MEKLGPSVKGNPIKKVTCVYLGCIGAMTNIKTVPCPDQDGGQEKLAVKKIAGGGQEKLVVDGQEKLAVNKS